MHESHKLHTTRENFIHNGVLFIKIINVVNKNREMAPQSKIYAGEAVQYLYIYIYIYIVIYFNLLPKYSKIY